MKITEIRASVHSSNITIPLLEGKVQGYDLDTAIAYECVIEPYHLRWCEEAGDPVDYELQTKLGSIWSDRDGRRLEDTLRTDRRGFHERELAHSDESDDDYTPGRAHPGCAVVPGARALGEQFEINGTHFLRAVTLATTLERGHTKACKGRSKRKPTTLSARREQWRQVAASRTFVVPLHPVSVERKADGHYGAERQPRRL